LNVLTKNKNSRTNYELTFSLSVYVLSLCFSSFFFYSINNFLFLFVCFQYTLKHIIPEQTLLYKNGTECNHMLHDYQCVRSCNLFAKIYTIFKAKKISLIKELYFVVWSLWNKCNLYIKWLIVQMKRCWTLWEYFYFSIMTSREHDEVLFFLSTVWILV